MKKFISIISVIIFAVTPFTFVSCDEDYEIADTLWVYGKAKCMCSRPGTARLTCQVIL